MPGDNGNGAASPELDANGNPIPPKTDPKPPENGGDGDDGKKTETVPHGLFHQEREKRKAAEAKIAEMEAAQAAKEAEDAAKRGEFEKLYTDEKTKREELETQLGEKSARIETFEAAAQANVDKMLSQIVGEEDKATVMELLKDKPIDAQERLLPNLLEKFGTPNNLNHTPKGGNNGAGNASQIDKDIEATEKEMAEAKKAKDVPKVMKLTRKLNELKESKKI